MAESFATSSLLRQAWRSVARHRARSLASATGIGCSVASFIVTLALGEGAARLALEQVDYLGARNVVIEAPHDAGTEAMSWASLQQIERLVPEVRRVGAIREVAAEVAGAEASAPVLSVTPSLVDILALPLAAGRFIQDDDMRRREPVCVVGPGLAARVGAEGRPGGTLRVGNSLCRVVGVLASRTRPSRPITAVTPRDFDRALLLPLGVERAITGGGESTAHQAIVQMRDARKVMASMGALRHAIALTQPQPGVLNVVPSQQLLRQAAELRRNFERLALGFACLCLAMGALSIANAIVTAIAERVREIGIRRAVGATRRHIAVQFVAEAAVLAACGCALGLALGMAGTWSARWALGLPASVTFAICALPIATALAVGTVAGVIPAFRAASLDPVEALRAA